MPSSTVLDGSLVVGTLTCAAWLIKTTLEISARRKNGNGTAVEVSLAVQSSEHKAFLERLTELVQVQRETNDRLLILANHVATRASNRDER